MRGMDDFLKLLTRVGLLAGALFFCPLIHSESNQELSKVREQIQQIEAIGLEWPPLQGWIDSVVGQNITEAQARQFEQNNMPRKFKPPNPDQMQLF